MTVSIALAQMLEARDRRAARQREMLAHFALPVVSLGVVMPGPVKDGPPSRIAFAVAMEALGPLLAGRGWLIRHVERVVAATGPEALVSVEAEASALKTALIDLEDGHPLGRLWDFDVICPERGQISRRVLGRAPRRCLICGDEGHACSRAQRHSLADLMKVIEEMVDAYRHPPSA